MRLLLGLCAIGLMVGVMPAMADDTTPTWCDQVVAHKPRDDVAFQPGVDVNGKAVAPADAQDEWGAHLSSSALFPVEIPITVDMAGRMGLNNGAAKLGGEAILGVARIDADGHVAFNGRDITPQMQTLCSPSTKPTP